MGWGANTTGYVCSAGFGVNTSATTNSINTANDTYIDTSFPALTAGTATRFVAKLYKASTAAAPTIPTLTSAKIKIFRLDGADYDLVGECTITAHVKAAAVAAGEAAARFSYDTSATYGAETLVFDDDTTGNPIAVQAGDYIGFFCDAIVYCGFIVNTGYSCKYETDAGANDITTTLVGATAETLADRSFAASLIVSTPEYLAYSSDGGGDGFVENEVIHVPGFSTEPFYVIFEDVIVPNGEDLKITASYVNGSNAIAADEYIHIDMTQSAGAETLKQIGRDTTVRGTQTVTYYTGDKYTISICIRPDFQTGYGAMQSLAVNYVNGQGKWDGGDNKSDVAHLSLASRKFSGFSVLGWKGDTNLWRWTLTQTTGDAATVAKVYTVRKPVIVVGDSFVSSKTAGDNPTVLARIGNLLDTAWTYDNYVLNGGNQGNELLRQVAGHVNPMIAVRFNSIGYDLAFYPYARYIFVNGPCINDIATAAVSPTTNAAAISIGKTAANAVGYMASYVVRNNSEAVMTEVCYLEAGHALQNEYTDKAVLTFNQQAKEEAARIGIPFARYADAVRADGDTYYNADHIHLSEDGDAYLATKIVDAFENNRVPSSSGSSPGLTAGGKLSTN
jgi:hypothetical protein